MSQSNRELLLVLKSFCASLFLVVMLGNSAAAQEGEALFRGHCASCHMIEKDMTGPALEGVVDRWKGKEKLLHEWIKNPPSVAESGDPYVTALVNEWKPKAGIMPPQGVSDEEINAILDYITNYQPPVAAVSTVGQPQAASAPDEGVNMVWLLIVLFILLIVVFSLMGLNKSLTKLDESIKQKEGIAVEQKLTGAAKIKAWLWENKEFASVVGVILIVVISVKGYEALLDIGVYEGYKPAQPIEFNHSLHAGEMEISCVYCHSSARDSRHAGIPSANVCMNCHKAISSGRTPDGTEDIQKIYHAVGWDPETQTYSGEIHPIAWIKVHNLPDLAYFNHSQHYMVGGIECQTCHGEVQEDFTVAQQVKPLTMGWCIDCHNTTPVQMQGNGYYDEIHERLVDHGKEELKKYLEDGTITARELGGWECAKCHY